MLHYQEPKGIYKLLGSQGVGQLDHQKKEENEAHLPGTGGEVLVCYYIMCLDKSL